MENSDKILNLLFTFLPPLIILIVSVAILWGCYWFLIGRRPGIGNERKFPLQILMLVLTIVGILAFVIALPISDSSRNQIIGLIGILISGIIAFSSTTVIGNLMAGVVLRITKPFRTGDFIRVGDFFGRVSERGLFDTEIQSESRELIALPNTYLISHPVSTIRSSGAIVSATLSLGYDIHHLKIEPLLIKAAEETGLKDPFVHILELGNFSITYRVSGLLADVKGLLTARSNLFRTVLNTLHGNGIEIMSPAFMNQRRIAEEQKVIPTFVQVKPEKEAVGAEEIVFDKAEQAEQLEAEKKELIEDIGNLETALKETEGKQKEEIKEKIQMKRERLKTVEQAQVEASVEPDKTEPIISTNSKKPRR